LKNSPQQATPAIRHNVTNGLISMICNGKDLSPDQKAVIENILGRRVLEDESVSVRAFESPALSDDKRAEILHGLEAYFAEVDAQRKPVSSAEADEILNEALRSSRPNYRPVR
jgi:hypothetical protein